MIVRIVRILAYTYTSSWGGTNKPKRYRLSAKVLQDTKSNYDTDIFGPLLAAVHDLVGGGWRVQQILPAFHRMLDVLTNGWREFLTSMSFNSVEVEDENYTTGCAMSMSCHVSQKASLGIACSVQAKPIRAKWAVTISGCGTRHTETWLCLLFVFMPN